jgi:hypothetical protein
LTADWKVCSVIESIFLKVNSNKLAFIEVALFTFKADQAVVAIPKAGDVVAVCITGSIS